MVWGSKTLMWGQPPRLPCFAEAPSEAEGEAEAAVQRAKRANLMSKPRIDEPAPFA